MSNTYKTTPLWVMMARGDKEARKHIGLREEHDHRNGSPCDLPDKPQVRDDNGQATIWGNTRCHWDWSYIGVQTCGCELCTGAKQRRFERRAHRHRASTNYRQLVHAVNTAGPEDEDAILDSLEVADARSSVSPTW